MKTTNAFARTPAMTSRRIRATHGLRTLAAAAILAVGTCFCSGNAISQRDVALRDQLIGTWTTKAFGTQELTNNSDGTARLQVTLNRLAAIRYGKSLSLELTWTVQDGVMRHTVLGGSPPEKVARLVKDWGSTLEYEVIEITESHITLEKPDDDDQSIWEAKTEVATR